MADSAATKGWCITWGMLLAMGATPAQCPPAWSVSPIPGVSAIANCTTAWDPDGPGPLPHRVVFGGAFEHAANLQAKRVVAYDPAAQVFQPLGAGFDGPVHSLLALPNGRLVAAGQFQFSGTTAVAGIAEWNGIGWQPLGSGLGGVGSALTSLVALPTGDLVAAGTFSSAGGQPVGGVARWDGTQWHALGTGVAGGWPSAAAVRPNGNLVLGGSFRSAGGAVANGIAEWNGNNWQAIAGVVTNTQVSALLTMPNGNLAVGGWIYFPGRSTAEYSAVWDGVAFGPLGVGMPATQPQSFALLPNGRLLACFHAAGLVSAAFGVSQLVAGNWTPWDAGPPANRSVWGMAPMPNGDLYVCGPFVGYGPAGPHADRVARWSAAAGVWQALALGGNEGYVRCAAVAANGDLLVGGDFRRFEGIAANCIAQRVAGAWQPMHTGLGSGAYDEVRAIVPMPNGDVLAGGQFALPTRGLARWNGTTWSGFGGGTNGVVNAIARRPNGNVVVAGDFTLAGSVAAARVAEWNGVTWQALGAGVPRPVLALCIRPDGSLVVAVESASGPGDVRAWNGSTWSVAGQLGYAGPSPVWPGAGSLTCLRNGNVVAAGLFGLVNGVPCQNLAQWNGSLWSPMPGNLAFIPHAVTELPDGSILVSADEVVGSTVVSVWKRWNGAWSTTAAPLPGGIALAQAWSPLGRLSVVYREYYGGLYRMRVADGAATCPPDSQPLPTGCVGPVGPMQLAHSPAWVGSELTSTGTGYAANSLGVVLFGFVNPAQPLAALVPLGIPGCDLLASPEVVLWVAAGNGVAVARVAIANVPALAGMQLFHQHVQVAFAAGGGIASVSSSGGARLTVGDF